MIMPPEKPANMEEYECWLKEQHNVEITSRSITYYETVASKVERDFKSSSFWQAVGAQLQSINQEYYLKTNYYLLAVPNDPLPDLQKKPFKSFLLKTFRRNILANSNWPNEPEGGWLLPDNWFSRVNDIVRTYFVVKYLDGVDFLASKLAVICSSNNCNSRVDFEAKEEGYYAAHFYVAFPCEIPREDWDTKPETISIELQITTQLQEVIRRLLHSYYERRRIGKPLGNSKWQWDYKSEEFGANYLGHILHYIEGMIMEVRDKKS